jgi:hypothetical protein
MEQRNTVIGRVDGITQKNRVTAMGFLITKENVPIDKTMIDNRILALENPQPLEKTCVQDVTTLLREDRNIIYRSLKENAEYYVIGDLHGDYDTLIKILFTVYESKDSEKVFLFFLGDYIDRGRKSTEVLSTLLTLFLLFPNHIVLQKGNHERFFCENGEIIPESYPADYWSVFQKNTMNKEKLAWLLFIGLFGSLPICTVLETTRQEKILLTHAGIPDTRILKKASTFEQIFERGDQFRDQLNLPYTPESNFLWRDPSDEPAVITSPRYPYTVYDFIILRKQFGITRLIRSHEYAVTGIKGKDRGYKTHFKKAPDSVLTIFSTGGKSPDTAYPNVENPALAKIEANGEVRIITI